MSTNKELHGLLRSARARFYLADFHVHSPASADVRMAPHYDALSQEARDLLGPIPEIMANSPVEYESEVMTAFPASRFLDALVARRNAALVDLGSEGGDDWAIVAVTDHNVCKYSCDLAALAWKQLSQHRMIVMPGIELDVSYPVPPSNKQADAHLLCIFAPTSTESDLRIAISTASGTTWEFGQKLPLQSLDSFVNSL